MSLILPNSKEKRKEKIRDLLKNDPINDDLIQIHLDMILYGMMLVECCSTTTPIWTTVTYSSKNNKFVAFTNSVNNMYINFDGNVYFDETHYLQYIQKVYNLNEVWKYGCEADAIKTNIPFISDYSYLLTILRCFYRLKISVVFKNFLLYITEEQPEEYDKTIKLLNEMKFYTYFFTKLNCYSNAGVVFNENNVIVCFPSCQQCRTSVKEFATNPNRFLTRINSFSPKNAEDYTILINQFMSNEYITDKDIRTHENDLKLLNLVPEYNNILHKIAISVLKLCGYNFFKLTHLRSVISWLQWRFNNRAQALLFYIQNKLKLGNEYALLIEVVKSCESQITHHFYNYHTAGDHLCRHFKPIRGLRQYNHLTLVKTLPRLKAENRDTLIECAEFYFITVANDVFNKPAVPNNDSPRPDSLNYYFSFTHEDQKVRGVKFLISNTYNPATDADKLRVCSIQEITNKK